MFDASFWNQRYDTQDYIYGTEPNGFLVSVASQIPAGPVLCLAEGEGRNATYLASLGHQVTAVDQAELGLAKAARLAKSRGLTLETIKADLSDFFISPATWAGIAVFFAHLPPELRRRVFAKAVEGLRPGGVFILEAYTPAQLRRDTGGPKELSLLMTADALRGELQGLEFPVLRETERDISEGTGHTGIGAVVQVLGIKPRPNA